MKFILFLILMSHDGSFELSEAATYATMDKCFEGRSIVVEMLGRPIVSYSCMCKNTKIDGAKCKTGEQKVS